MPVRTLYAPFAPDQRVWAKFARLNKRNSLEEYREECDRLCGYDWVQCRIVKRLVLSQEDYDKLAQTLMEPHNGFAELGGTESDSPCKPDRHFNFKTEGERDDWVRKSYCRVALACAPGREPFVIAPQGYSYARYVGLDIRPEPPEIRNPGDPAGRWMIGPEDERGVVTERGQVGGNMTFYPAIVMDGKGRLKAEVPIAVFEHSVWRWAFSEPDYEKMPPEQVAELQQRLRTELARRAERNKAELRALREHETRMRAEFDCHRPEWAKAVIVAAYHVSESDPEEGISWSREQRRVFLAWSRHTRDLFSELRKAAAAFSPTAHLAEGPKTYERQDASSYGRGRFLSDASLHDEGWKVLKLSCDYAATKQLIWDTDEQPCAQPELSPAAPEKS